jgi:basic membrane lipoprotein Med (substrate-binding protein (PBP1-ABC) superfamily)
MILGRCYCAKIRQYESDREKLEQADTVIDELETAIEDAKTMLQKTKDATRDACFVDMGAFNPATFNQKARDCAQSAAAAIKQRRQQIETDINYYRRVDRKYHQSVNQERTKNVFPQY